jgi:hypothetical protein
VADELFASIPGSVTNYAIIRRASDGYAADDAADAFEAWADGSIDDYDIPLTSQGGDYYTADFPTWITAGTYDIIYYVQAGATPATTDDIHASERLYWNGSSVSSSPSSDYLTTLARVKIHLGISSSTYDSSLTNKLGAASRAIENYCDRMFLSTAVTEYFNGSGTDYLQLNYFPVTLMTRVAACPEVVLSIRNSTADRARVYVSATNVTLSSTTAAVTTTTNLAVATYTTVTTMAAAINAVSGWSATIVGDNGGLATGDFRAIQGTFDAVNCDAELELFVEDVVVRVNPDTGRVYGRWPFGFQNIQVSYSGGYAAGTVPDPVQEACCELVALMHRASTTDSSKKSERLGDYAYTNFDQVGGSMGASSLIFKSPMVMELLSAYRLPHAIL